MEYKVNTTSKIIIAEAVLVLGILGYLFLLNTPNASSPISGQTIFDPNIVFEVGKGEQLLISPYEDFRSYISLEEGDETDLLPGKYYWKVKNLIRESEVKTFTIESNVALDLYNRGDNYELGNSGNVGLDVKKTKSGITSESSLEPGESQQLEKDDSKYQGEQK